jgi:hypothetical protein
LLDDFAYDISKTGNKKHIVTLKTPKGKYYLSIESNKESELVVNRITDDPKFPDGWQSRYYGEKTPALSVRLTCKSNNGCNFVSMFTDNYDYISSKEY